LDRYAADPDTRSKHDSGNPDTASNRDGDSIAVRFSYSDADVDPDSDGNPDTHQGVRVRRKTARKSAVV
jgi:hypothetical protein